MSIIKYGSNINQLKTNNIIQRSSQRTQIKEKIESHTPTPPL